MSQELHYWKFTAYLSTSQRRTFVYLMIMHETSPDKECNKILGEYLDAIKVPPYFNEEDVLE